MRITFDISEPPRRFAGETALIALVAVVSAALAGAGFYGKLTFDNTPGEQLSSPQSWPRDSALERRPGVPTLLVFAHPFCSCTDATLKELARVLAASPVPPDTRVLIEPEVADDSGASLRLWKRASAIPNTKVSWDLHGREAAIFGARTSGIVYLYSAKGSRLFEGGITVSRGHEGIGLGEEALASSLASQRPSKERPFVFGCSLLGVGL